MSYKVFFEIGHDAAIRSKRTLEGFTHDWEIYVRGFDKIDLSHFVDKVVFHLHDTFHRPKRVVKDQPFAVKESGYAGFALPVHIYFKTSEDTKKVSYIYELTLQQSGPPVSRKQQHSFVFHNPSEEFRHKLIRGGAILISTDESVLSNNELYNKPRLSSVSAPSTAITTAATTMAMNNENSAASSTNKKSKGFKDEPKLVDDMFNYFGSPITKKAKSEPSQKHKDKQQSVDKQPKQPKMQKQIKSSTSNGKPNAVSTSTFTSANSTSAEAKKKDSKTDQKIQDASFQDSHNEKKSEKKSSKSNPSGSKDKKEDGSHKKSSGSSSGSKPDKKSSSASKSDANNPKSMSSTTSSSKKERRDAKLASSTGSQTTPNKNPNSKSSSKDLTTKNEDQKSEKCDKSKKHHDGSSANSRTTFSGSKRKHGEDEPNVNTSTSSSGSSSSTTNNSYTNVPSTYPLPQSSSPYRPPLNSISNLIDSDSTSEDERSAAFLEQHENNIDKLNDFKIPDDGNLGAVELTSPTHTDESITINEPIVEKKYSDDFFQKLQKMQEKINTTNDRDLLQKAVNLISETNAFAVTGCYVRFDLMKLEPGILIELQKILDEYD